MTRAVPLLLLLASVARAGDPSALVRLFPEEADVYVGDARLARLPLPPAVLAACRPDLSDVRLFDRDGQETPYLVDRGRAPGVGMAETLTVTPRVTDVRRWHETRANEPQRAREEYGLAVPADAPTDAAWELVVTTPRTGFARRITVSGAGEDGRPRLLVEDAPLVRIDGAEHTRVPLPAGVRGVLTVVVRGDEADFLEPAFTLEARRTLGPGGTLTSVPLAPQPGTAKPGTTVLEIDRPVGLVPERLRIETDTPSFDRRVTVWDVRPGSPDVRLGSGRVLRVGTKTPLVQPDVELDAARGTRLRLEIADGDSPPLANLRLQALFPQPALLLLLAPNGDAPAGVLRFGGGRAAAPEYDLAALLHDLPAAGDAARVAGRLYDPAELGTARLGPVRANPAFDDAPALAFAMRPGTVVDARTFAWRRPLPIPAAREGLVRVRLAPEDAARLRPDLADVRVVDAERRQWPYLLEPAAATQWLPLAVGTPVTRERRTRWRLTPPATPLAASELRLDVDTPFFDRAARILVRDPDGRERVLVTGPLVRDARRPEPLVVRLPAARADALELEVDDGDEAPLALLGASALVTVPALFVAAPAGTYTLLLGDPDATAPRYDVARARDVVLAVPATDASAGPAEANPDFSEAARLTGSGRPRRWLEQGAVWAVLLLAVGVLGLLTFRAARRPG
ncbi:MAG: hypothetical protein KIT14_06745 [bacterium]|nr:hypothetical protein [bacterium]